MKEKAEIIDPKSKFRVLIDLNIAGNANGGRFFRVKGLQEEIKKIEKSGKLRFIGLVYDDTDRLEILTQPISDEHENFKKKALD
tara:strand:+ start:672 stop:923 length:252 start_codon:yes stop_codon:yes gene_type:complete